LGQEQPSGELQPTRLLLVQRGRCDVIFETPPFRAKRESAGFRSMMLARIGSGALDFRIAWPPMKVHAIQTGTVAVKERQRSGTGPGPLRLPLTLADREWTEPLPIYAWVIEHPEGAIVVDTGETARVGEPGYFPRWHPYYRLGVKEWVEPEQEIGPQLRAIGIDPDDVRWLLMTHLHTDHAGGLGHFPRTEILVTRRELENASGAMGKLRGFLPHRWPEWFSPKLIGLEAAPYGPFPESFRLTDRGDVILVGTAGHTPGHVSVIVEEEDRSILLAGDTSYTEQLMIEGKTDGVSPDLDAARLTLRRIQELARQRPVVYLPSHDPGSAQRLEQRLAVKMPAEDQ
jgi:glyoxylase-like metal-dependent hydrolase (beta-lactamase superfamily II)